LEQLYRLTEQSGVTMPLAELGRSMRSLTDWALKEAPQNIGREWLLEQRRNAAGYAKKLFSAAVLFRRIPTQQVLSRREQEVLSCLSRGLTRAEIAGALSLSINTVKSIIRSIYNKLGAVNRSNAVQAAAAAGLLEERD
jgi:LuxR family maltose regulon positive regulatory protein